MAGRIIGPTGQPLFNALTVWLVCAAISLQSGPLSDADSLARYCEYVAGKEIIVQAVGKWRDTVLAGGLPKEIHVSVRAFLLTAYSVSR